MRVAAVPAFRNRAVNPYNSLLYGAIELAGIEVEEFGPRTLFGRPPDVVHIHWPEWLFSAENALRARAQSSAFCWMVTRLRNRGSRIVWSVHNLDGHYRWQPEHERLRWDWFTRHIDGWISMSQHAIDATIERYPHLARIPHAVIPHGHYLGVYPNVVRRLEVRHALGIPDDARVMAAIGNLQPYKQIPMLAQVFAQIPGDDVRLIIAGKAGRGVDADIRAVEDKRIVYRPGFVSNDDLQVYHRAADLVILPYRDILNSGSAILALSFGVPVLVPELGAMGELRHTIGGNWVQSYAGDLTPEHVLSALDGAPRRESPDLSALNWSRIGALTADFYQRVCASEWRPEHLPSAAPVIT